MRYNPPPTWPQPPAGWSPPPGWTPDPSWGPPPDGWPLWVADDAPGGAQWGGPRGGGPVAAGASGGRSTGTVVALAAVGVVVLVALGVGGVVLLRDRAPEPATVVAGGSSSSAAATATPEAPAAGTESDPKPLGQTSVVGDYEATLTRVVPDATAEILAENQFNEPPENGQFVLVDLAATYTGGSTGSALFDLYITLQGSDGEEYRDYDCSVVVPDDLSRGEELTPGATGTGSLCFDVPAAALPGATMSISLSGGDEETFFRTS